MKKISTVLCVALLAVMLQGCVAVNLSGLNGAYRTAPTSGTVAEKQYTLENNSFTNMDLRVNANQFTVHLANGPYEVRIVSDSAYLDTLTPYCDEDGLSIQNHQLFYTQPIDVYITAPAIELIYCEGATIFDVSTQLKGERFSLAVDGATTGNFDMDYEYLVVYLAGAGDLTFKGKVQDAKFDVSGAATIDAQNLITSLCKVDLAGAGEVSVRCEQTLDIEISGLGTVKYCGAASVNQDVSGLGSVKKMD